MTLNSETRLGPYLIVSPIGAGGMGEVYKARDTRLNRFVAIKVLPEHIANNLVAKQRFEREARTVAALNHPHICVLYDVGRQDGIDFLVMEYLEGMTLADRLSKGALPLPEAMKIALDIADALDKAHGSGVVHRDLKPGNIILADSGAKLLDFGLAKPTETSGNPAAMSDAPTQAAALTDVGVVLGTLQYMAPEQIEGEDADARSDIFAFGAVLYELLTGRKAFEGKSQPSLMSAILTSIPPAPSLVASGVPSALDHVIERCLAKNPADRWHSARDLWMELKWAGGSREPVETRAPAKRPGRRVWILSVVLAVLAILAVIPAVLYFRSLRSTATAAPDTRFEIQVPGMPSPYFIAISPDGRRVAYSATTSDGKTALWVRNLNSLEAQVLPGTAGASPPDWSPDSRFLAFAADGKLKKIDVTGGSPQNLTPMNGILRRSTWNRDGVIIFADGPILRRVSESGGEASNLTELDSSLGETNHSTPWFLPDGRHFLYSAWSVKPENRAFYIGSLDSKIRTRLMTAESKAIYSPPGFILFQRDGTLMARPFDANKREFTGEAVSLAEKIAYNPALGQSALYASAEGTMIYTRGGVADPSVTLRWLWTDRTGKPSGTIGPPRVPGNMRFSPDGTRVAFFLNPGAGAPDIWVYDIARDLTTPLTTDRAPDLYPVWSPDGSRLVFGSARASSDIALYEKPSNGAIAEKLILPSEAGIAMVPRDWSAKGNQIVFDKSNVAPGSQRDIWVLPLDGERKPFAYLATPSDESQAALSPNGRWLAYVSNEGGGYQVIVQPFPDPSAGKWQISKMGGQYPRWKRDGRELYYLDPDRNIVAVAVTTDGKFEVGKATPLFPTQLVFPTAGATNIPYDVTPDGQRFLISAPPAPVTTKVTPITVILNWPSLLKK